jgi:hypothetical protein
MRRYGLKFTVALVVPLVVVLIVLRITRFDPNEPQNRISEAFCESLSGQLAGVDLRGWACYRPCFLAAIPRLAAFGG